MGWDYEDRRGDHEGDDDAWVTFDDHEILVVTDAAMGVGPPFGEVAKWIPLSQVRNIEYDDGGDSEEVIEGELIQSVCVPRWFAEQENLDWS